MKIVLLNTYTHGGAGIACRRLNTALQGIKGIETTLLTRENTGRSWPFYAERLSFLPYERDKSVRFAYSLANFGTDLSRNPEIQSADIIHLHWINQGFLSLKNIQQLAKTGKPIFWTLHDMWAFTGGCHYNRGCNHFQTSHCGNCPMLKRPANSDLSNQIWLRKKMFYPKQLNFITCSDWLASIARSASLLKDFSIQSIPNPIDTNIFRPQAETDRQAMRQAMGIAEDVKIILFVAMNVNDERKGFRYLQEALRILHERPGSKYEVVVLGKVSEAVSAAIPFRVHAPGMLSNPAEMARYYSIADVFAAPSLEDNLPNTVMEALACGVPVAGFPTGGIPQMVDHLRNGYITTTYHAEELAKGIEYIAYGGQPAANFRQNARLKVVDNYDNQVVAKKHIDAYSKALSQY